MRQALRFILDSKVKTITTIDPTTTVLNYLRETLGRKGTKEGCAEGDCGACTVVIAEADEKKGLRFRAVNACIQFLPTLDGKALFTVESLVNPDGKLHPVQQAMIDQHGSQCGFCTPGFVMSLFALYQSETKPSRQRISDVLAGNLCRCTGYRPIIDAAEAMYAEPEKSVVNEQALLNQLATIHPTETLALKHDTRRYFAPTTCDELADLLLQYPAAHLLAGGTDVGLWVTKQHQDLDTVIYLDAITELKQLTQGESYLEVGAAVTLTDAYASLAKLHPDLGELLRRFASPPIRNVATLGGNIANGSPIGDSMPALIALDATLVLHRGNDRRELPLDAFYKGYRQTKLHSGEFIERIRVPLLSAESEFRAYKISKRFEQDISAVFAAFRLEMKNGQVADIRICYGGMAAIPQRAKQAERTLHSKDWTQANVTAAMAALTQDYTPLSDMRASDEYRMKVAQNLLQKFFLETTGHSDTRILDYGS